MQNTDISFTQPGEDDFFFKHDRILPYKSEVEEFNSAWMARGRQKPRLRGLDHPGLFNHPRTRYALAHIPGLRVIAIACDPLSRLDKLFWRFHLCRRDKTPLPVGPKRERRCWHSVGAALEEPEILTRWSMRDGLRSLQRLFGPRLHLIHQEYLRNLPWEAFNGVATFLGAAPFPPWAMFQRHNWERGHRTDLCRNATLFRVLKARLEPEYVAVEELLTEAGQEVTGEVQLRKTRCERAEELTFPSSRLRCSDTDVGACTEGFDVSEEGEEDGMQQPEPLLLWRLQVAESDRALRGEIAALRLEMARLSRGLARCNSTGGLA